jgi:predicted nucleotidyltransferase
MNIHSQDKKFLEKLKEMSFMRVRVGSHLYDMNGKDSDIDYLYLYVKPKELANSFSWEHHQLQFKEDGIDHNFTDLHSFIRNIMTGDSTINFEALHSEEFKNNPKVKFLYENRKWFYSYNIIRSYLGLSRRDLKMCTKVRPKVDGINHKKLYHACRGMRAAEHLMKGAYENVVSDMLFSKYLREIKDGKILKYEARELIKATDNCIGHTREELNKKFEDGLIPRVMSVYYMELLDVWLKGFTNQHQKHFDFDCRYFYNALEEGIKYD